MLPIDSKREFKLLVKAHEKAEEILHWPDARFYSVQDTVSLWSPAQQLFHLSLANLRAGSMIQTLYDDEAAEILREGAPSKFGRAMLMWGKITRGVALAPPTTDPPPEISRPEVRAALQRSGKLMEVLSGRASYLYDLSGRMQHPMLGELNAIQWLKFARVHSQHHLTIAKEIGEAFLKAEGKSR
ncbi:hypothetical protein BH09SUM1_BH09SUM1_32230 [soil metagenome]